MIHFIIRSRDRIVSIQGIGFIVGGGTGTFSILASSESSPRRVSAIGENEGEDGLTDAGEEED